MTTLSYDPKYEDHTHSLCLYRLHIIFIDLLLGLVIHNARSYNNSKQVSWGVVKDSLNAAMRTIEFNLKAQGFQSRDPPGLPVPRPKTKISAGGIAVCDEEGNEVSVQSHVGMMKMWETLEEDINILNLGFTRGHNMTREEGWTVVRALLKEAEARITEKLKMEDDNPKKKAKENPGT